MESSALIIAEMLITLGVCLGFGFWQLWDLRRERIKDAAKTAARRPPRRRRRSREGGVRRRGRQARSAAQLRRGILNGSIACTTGLAKRSSARLSCMAVTASPSSCVRTSERA